MKRKVVEFSKALEVLEADYPYYKREVQRFKSNITWDLVAREHIRLYVNVLAKRHKEKMTLIYHNKLRTENEKRAYLQS